MGIYLTKQKGFEGAATGKKADEGVCCVSDAGAGGVINDDDDHNNSIVYSDRMESAG